MFDEATASIDHESENAIQGMLTNTGAAATAAKSYALVPDEYYWISNDEYEYIPVKYVGTPGDTSGGAHRMCEFIGYNSEARIKAPSSRIKGRIPAPGRECLLGLLRNRCHQHLERLDQKPLGEASRNLSPSL